MGTSHLRSPSSSVATVTPSHSPFVAARSSITTICCSFTKLPRRLRRHWGLHPPPCSAPASHRSSPNLPRTAPTIRQISTMAKAKLRSSTLRQCLRHMDQIRRRKPSKTLLSVLLSLALAHGPLDKIARSAASAERRTVRSGCPKSYQSAARGSQWSFIRRRFVERLAVLMAGSRPSQQLSPPKQVCQDLGSTALLGSSNHIARRMSTQPHCSAASHLIRAHRSTRALGCFLSRSTGRKRSVMLIGTAFVPLA